MWKKCKSYPIIVVLILLVGCANCNIQFITKLGFKYSDRVFCATVEIEDGRTLNNLQGTLKVNGEILPLLCNGYFKPVLFCPNPVAFAIAREKNEKSDMVIELYRWVQTMTLTVPYTEHIVYEDLPPYNKNYLPVYNGEDWITSEPMRDENVKITLYADLLVIALKKNLGYQSCDLVIASADKLKMDTVKYGHIIANWYYYSIEKQQWYYDDTTRLLFDCSDRLLAKVEKYLPLNINKA